MTDEILVPKQFDQQFDEVKKPSHYCSHPSGVECKDIIMYFTWPVGSAIKYLWRCGLKGDAIEDLEKAKECIQIEIDKIKKERSKNNA
ncbi:MAG: DUF3310 domain-containing protein [Chloroflexi bacterium]|nr:MAG: DUF3310 domain-containing protein [Chloroflexota bacterium]